MALADGQKPWKKEFWTRERQLLLLVVLGAMMLRSFPNWFFSSWGNDSGIYYGIARQFASNPQLVQPYDGWGASYGSFPVMYLISSGLEGLTGLDASVTMGKFLPILGGFTALFLYIIVREWSHDKRLALVAAAMLAANPFHIYQTSHAAPLTVGHFFMMMSFMFYVLSKKDRFYLGPLYLSTILLIGSHHLTTSFFLFSLSGIVIVKAFKVSDWKEWMREELFYLFFASGATFAYWFLVATSVYRGFIDNAFGLPAAVVVGAFYAILMVCILLAWNHHNGKPFPFKSLIHRVPSKKGFIATLVLTEAFTLFFVLAPLPPTGFKFLWTAPLLLLPQYIILALAVYGLGKGKELTWHFYVIGWLAPLGAAFLFSTFTWNDTLLPYRFLEYLAYPLAILGAIGALSWYRSLDGKRKKRKAAYALGLIIAFSGLSAYLVQEATSGYEEAVPFAMEDALEYMESDTNITFNTSIATDHRLSTHLWGEGYRNLTYDDAMALWHAEDLQNQTLLDELNGSTRVGNISYVLLDSVIYERGPQSGLVGTTALNDTQYAKFSQYPFFLLERFEDDMGGWVELYRVNW